MRLKLQIISSFVKLSLFGLIVLMNNGFVWAQERVVSGTVFDENQEGLPGVNIVLKGTTIGTISDYNGVYRLNLPEEGGVLLISAIGYSTKEIPIGSRSIIDHVMEVNIEELEELVVIGYGTRAKRDLTGSVATISQKDLSATPVISADLALQGRTAGVSVTQNSGAPGAATSVKIRGTSSISAGNEPLYVIDGVPILSSVQDITTGSSKGDQLNPLSTINPNDIVSMEVLKDASAAAIYGARGANGVVIITTKRGESGTPKFEIATYQGWQEVREPYELLNATQFAQFVNEASFNGGLGRIYSNPSAFGYGTDWQDVIFQRAAVSSYDMTLTGGSDKITYGISGGYFQQEGIIVGSDFQRYSTRINVDAEITKKLKFQNTLLASHIRSMKVTTDDNSGFDGGSITAALSFNPMLPTKFENGNYVDKNYQVSDDGAIILADSKRQPINGNANPLLKNLESPSQDRLSRIVENMSVTFEITEKIMAKVNLGFDFSTSREDQFTPSLSRSGGDAFGSSGTNSNLTLLNENIITYNNNFGIHDLDMVVGYTAQKSELSRMTTNAIRFDNELLGYYDLSLGQGVSLNNNQSEYTFLSFLGRVNYIIMDKYLFTITARRDGSSKFGANEKWGFFPSGSFAWRISDEDLIQSLNFFDDFKLRIGYGVVGNESIGPYSSLSPLINNVTSFNESLAFGYEPFFLSNADLKWESTAQLNVGLDISFFDARVNITSDIYSKRTTDLLLTTLVPFYTGFGNVLGNLGDLQNEGFEFSVTSNNFVKKFKWNTSFNFSTNKNTILSLGDRDSIPNSAGPFTNESWAILVEGQEVGIFYGYEFDGIVQLDDDLDAIPKFVGETLNPGNRYYKDLNNDGIITADKDRTFIGRAQPQFTIGLDNNFSYLGWSLSLFFQGVFGNDIMNFNKFLTERQTPNNNISLEYYANRWSPTNPSNVYPKVTTNVLNTHVSSAQVESGTYLRLRSISLGYEFPRKILEFVKISSGRIYVTGKNLWTLTNYSGYDPEVSHFGQSATNFGADLGGYPNSKMILLGLNLIF